MRRPPGTAALELTAVFRHLPTPYLVMTPDLVIVEANDAYLDTVGRSREELVGTPVFEAFPPTPDALGEDGVPRVQVSFERARDTGRADRMPLQKYDIPDPVNGGLVERFWSLTSVPILDDEGRTVLIVQRAEDVTEYVHQHSGPADGVPLGRPGRLEESVRTEGGSLQQRFDALEADLVARAHELAAAIDSRELAARRLAGLAELALRLGGAEHVSDVARILDRQQLAVLGAAGATVVVPDSDGGWDVPLSTDLGAVAATTYRLMPPMSSMPASWVARTGQRLLLLTAEEGRAWHEGMVDVHEATGMTAWAFLPLRARASVLGCLAIGWVDTPDLSADDVELLEGFAAQLAQTLDRIRATEAEASANREVRRLSETLQRSLLHEPALPPTLQVAVRYVPAAEHAHVGGDWYDAFVTTSGTTLVAIGDVTGHDGTAAATMAQIRSLLRGLAYDAEDTPAVLLARLDRALHGLQLDTLATAVLAQVESVPDPTSPAGRRCRLRWSNAGHLSPLLRRGDGTVTTLDGDHDLLLGLDPATGRSDHAVDLDAGCTLVLHTDGLIERRTTGLQQGMDLVREALAGHGDADPETLCDKLLASVAPQRNEDDIALLVLRLTDAADC